MHACILYIQRQVLAASDKSKNHTHTYILSVTRSYDVVVRMQLAEHSVLFRREKSRS